MTAPISASPSTPPSRNSAASRDQTNASRGAFAGPADPVAYYKSLNIARALTDKDACYNRHAFRDQAERFDPDRAARMALCP